MDRDDQDSRTATCAAFRQLLEHRLADEAPPAGAGEHGLECAECRALEGLIEALAEVPPLESEALAGRVLASFEAGRHGRRRNRLALLSGAGALAAAAALLLALVPQGTGRPGTPEPASATGNIAFTIDADADRGPGAGDRLVADRGPLLLSSDRGISIGLAEGASMTFVALDARAPILALESGQAAFMLDGTAPAHVDVEAASTRVRLLAKANAARTGDGDAMAVVMVEVAGSEVRVDVAQGLAVFEIDGPSADRAGIALTTGTSAGTSRRVPAALEPDRHRSMLALLDLPLPDGKGAAASTGEQTGSADEAVDDPAVPAPERHPDRTAKDGRTAGGGATPRGDVGPGPGQSSPGALITEAREQRAAGNWSAAADLYRQVLDGHPTRPEATAVLVPLAELELEHLRRPDLALRHFGLYVGRHPTGPLAEEALYGKCLALRAMGQANEEAAALTEFLRRYPESVRAQRVKSRLDILGEKIE